MNAPRRTWIRMNPKDEVAVALTDLQAGTAITSPDGSFSVVIRQPIPFGHKFAIRQIQKGQPVHKYGEVIGTATQGIAPGDHVHIHNVESLRGRGDLHRAAVHPGPADQSQSADPSGREEES